MFTGIIECMGTLMNSHYKGSNLELTVHSPISSALTIDQSVAHNGVCLTVTNVTENTHTLVAVEETLRKTNVGKLTIGDLINLERCMPANGRFDGHIVQGHVDTVATVTHINDRNGSWVFTFGFESESTGLVVEKGSICINGVSLTIVDALPTAFSVAIIPYTFENTTFRYLTVGSIVNIEYDIIGKYIAKMMQSRSFHIQ